LWADPCVDTISCLSSRHVSVPVRCLLYPAFASRGGDVSASAARVPRLLCP